MLVYEQAGSGDILSSFQVSCCMQVVSSLSPPRPTAVTLKSLFRRLSHHHPKVNVFLFAALESIADMLCSSILHGALGHGLRVTAVSACCASQAHYASGFCRSMCSVVVSSMCSVLLLPSSGLPLILVSGDDGYFVVRL
jgi:hypothetical protein